jgi:Raf kinase inhibitor-like YbhB/YbcL family protein
MKSLGALVMALGCFIGGPSGAQSGETSLVFSISSYAFKPGGSIPRTFTADGTNVSPALMWENPPSGTRAFALICCDPDAPSGTWVHWVIWNLPAPAKGLAEGVPQTKVLADGSCQGKNDFGRIGYGGPSPPPGKPHRYFFRVFALSERLAVLAGASSRDLEKAMEGKILGIAEVFGIYER